MLAGSMLEVRNLYVNYGAVNALSDVNLRVEEGEIVALIGNNGAGKSTTLMSISAIVPARSGQIVFEGEQIERSTPHNIFARGIVQVPEGRHIFPQMTVEENMLLGAYLRRDKSAIRRDMENIYEHFPILAKRAQQVGGALSGGEQQMLAISRAMMSQPKLLLLDEPSMGLAPKIIKQIFDLIKQINQEQKKTILLVEQNSVQALQIANRGYVLENGQTTITDDADKLLVNPAVRGAYLGI